MNKDQKSLTVFFLLALMFLSGIMFPLMCYEKELLSRLVLLSINLMSDAVLCISYFIMYNHLRDAGK